LSDPGEIFLPHEVRGGVGQLGDPGGGLVPPLEPPPVPNAIANASPGASVSALTTPLAQPTVPSPDPATLALAIARLAGEAFGGASIAPVSSPAQVGTSSSAAVPVSPGISPVLAPGVPVPAGAPSVPAIPAADPNLIPMSIAAPLSASFDPSTIMSASGWGDMRVPMFDAPAVPELDAPPPYAVPASVPPMTELPELRAEHDPGVPVNDLGGAAFDPHVVRRDFPILDEKVHGGKRLVWLDNAATTQKPRAVIDRLSYFYEHENSNIHRAAHTLAARATDAYEQGRATTAKFLHAPSPQEIVFVRGATEGINLIAQAWGRRNVGAGDEILVTHLEHHANIVPWQMLCAQTGAKLKVAPVDDRGDVILEEYERLITPRTKIVAFPQVSNALGTITPAREMVAMARRHGARVLVDGAQAVSHMPVDVQDLDCDFYVFSGHKVFAPTGIGVVYGKRDVLEQMPPWQGGGNMIQDVTFERTSYQPPPFRFEAGTGNIADAAGLGTALDYIMRIGMETIDRYEHELLVYATERMVAIPGLTMIGTSPNKAGVLSFVMDGLRTEDIGAALDADGIAVRSGHHCAQPILRRFGLESTVRASLAFYNICEDIDAMIAVLRRLAAQR
jgi:cysteine desulfurase/selenocysteine lyase